VVLAAVVGRLGLVGRRRGRHGWIEEGGETPLVWLLGGREGTRKSAGFFLGLVGLREIVRRRKVSSDNTDYILTLLSSRKFVQILGPV
jgi:hypothetical protein